MGLIDADALAEKLLEIKTETHLSTCPYSTIASAIDAVKDAPTVDPVTRGRWIYSRTESEFAVSKCSVCGEEYYSISRVVADGKYCPSCGAKMDL